MGMGEPFINFDNVIGAAQRLPDVGITSRRTTISTVGWLPGLVEKERQRAAAAQRQMEENAEAAARLQAEFEERLRRQDGELSIAQRKALAAEERIAALHETMQAQQTRAAERTEAATCCPTKRKVPSS